MVMWTGKPWVDGPDGPSDPPKGNRIVIPGPWAPADRERFYRTLGRTSPVRIKPARKPDWSALLGLVGLVIMAALVTGGVFFWLGAFAAWMNTR